MEFEDCETSLCEDGRTLLIFAYRPGRADPVIASLDLAQLELQDRCLALFRQRAEAHQALEGAG